jgi:hypothetical protein
MAGWTGYRMAFPRMVPRREHPTSCSCRRQVFDHACLAKEGLHRNHILTEQKHKSWRRVSRYAYLVKLFFRKSKSKRKASKMYLEAKNKSLFNLWGQLVESTEWIGSGKLLQNVCKALHRLVSYEFSVKQDANQLELCRVASPCPSGSWTNGGPLHDLLFSLTK